MEKINHDNLYIQNSVEKSVKIVDNKHFKLDYN